jgi:hypothetical protein
VQRRRAIQIGSLLAVVAGALMAAIVIIANVARLGTAIANEIRDAQNDYLQMAGSGQLAEINALKLGQCLRREMIKLAPAGFAHHETWTAKTRTEALPLCRNGLPPLPTAERTTIRVY